jgi:hypothetical protein
MYRKINPDGVGLIVILIEFHAQNSSDVLSVIVSIVSIVHIQFSTMINCIAMPLTYRITSIMETSIVLWIP